MYNAAHVTFYLGSRLGCDEAILQQSPESFPDSGAMRDFRVIPELAQMKMMGRLSGVVGCGGPWLPALVV
ncbi:MAG: hypothetical protein N2512_02165 [Armatimonadetes bacterium]|nr:hypothetical protein [Armatimonadota bacterium]